jgi:hypothetical protein
MSIQTYRRHRRRHHGQRHRAGLRGGRIEVTIVEDVNEAALERGLKTVSDSLERWCARTR